MKKILFVAILILAASLRLFFLAKVPPSPSLDEATIGWNAYSILQTGHDEYGYHLPILLRAYDDYRPALYVYMVIPFVKLLGLSVLAVRLPAALMSITTVAMVFFLTRSVFWFYKKRDTVAFLAMTLFAISPWSIYDAHLGHEVNLGLTLVIAASLLFFLAMEYKKGLLLISSFGMFALSFYGYQSEKLFAPLFLLALCIIFWKTILHLKKYFLFGLVVAVIITLPIFFASISPGALLRLKGTSIFIDNAAYTQSAKQLLIAKEHNNIIGELLANRRITTFNILVENYFVHFNPKWLFGNSGNEEFKAPNEGLLYIWEFPFILLGIGFLLFNKKLPVSIKLVIVSWTLIAFLPSAIATGAPQAMRSITLLPVPQILTALGILFVLTILQKYAGRVITIGVVFLLSIIVIQSLGVFAENYFVRFPIYQSESFQYALKNTMEYVDANKKNYQHVIVSNNSNLYQSYMFYLFYAKYDPKKYAASGGTKSGGFAETHVIDNITFRPINWQKENMKDTLFVGNPNDFPKSVSPVFVSNYLDGTTGVTITGENKPTKSL